MLKVRVKLYPSSGESPSLVFSADITNDGQGTWDKGSYFIQYGELSMDGEWREGDLNLKDVDRLRPATYFLRDAINEIIEDSQR